MLFHDLRLLSSDKKVGRVFCRGSSGDPLVCQKNSFVELQLPFGTGDPEVWIGDVIVLSPSGEVGIVLLVLRIQTLRTITVHPSKLEPVFFDSGPDPIRVVGLADRWISIPDTRRSKHIYGCGNTLIDLQHLTFQQIGPARQSPEPNGWRCWRTGFNADELNKGDKLQFVGLGIERFVLYKPNWGAFRLYELSFGCPTFVSEFVASFPIRKMVPLVDRGEVVVLGPRKGQWYMRERWIEVHRLRDKAIIRLTIPEDVAVAGTLQCAFSDGERVGLVFDFRKTRKVYQIASKSQSLVQVCLASMTGQQLEHAKAFLNNVY
jgi:hypothetical protein